MKCSSINFFHCDCNFYLGTRLGGEIRAYSWTFDVAKSFFNIIFIKERKGRGKWMKERFLSRNSWKSSTMENHRFHHESNFYRNIFRDFRASTFLFYFLIVSTCMHIGTNVNLKFGTSNAFQRFWNIAKWSWKFFRFETKIQTMNRRTWMWRGSLLHLLRCVCTRCFLRSLFSHFSNRRTHMFIKLSQKKSSIPSC